VRVVVTGVDRVFLETRVVILKFVEACIAILQKERKKTIRTILSLWIE